MVLIVVLDMSILFSGKHKMRYDNVGMMHGARASGDHQIPELDIADVYYGKVWVGRATNERTHGWHWHIRYHEGMCQAVIEA